MKIAFLIESLAVSCGGPARVAASVASELALRGHSVTLVTLPSSLEEVCLHENVNVYRLASKSFNPLRWLSILDGLRRIVRHVDVLFVSGIWGAVDGLLLSLLFVDTTPIHTRICGMLQPYILSRHPVRKALARFVYVNRNLSASSSLLVNSQQELTHVRSLGIKTPINIIPNGVTMPSSSQMISRREALDALNLKINASSKVLLYLSRIHPKKGLHYLLEAIDDPFVFNPDWHLVVAGSFYEGENYEATIRNYVSSSSHQNRIHFIGEVSGLRKHAAFSISDLFVLPSESEGFSNAVIEALSWKIPVVITEGCNFPDVARTNSGWVIPPGASYLKETLSVALSDLPTLKKMGGNAAALIQKSYLHHNIVSMYETLALRSVL